MRAEGGLSTEKGDPLVDEEGRHVLFDQKWQSLADLGGAADQGHQVRECMRERDVQQTAAQLSQPQCVHPDVADTPGARPEQ